MFCSSQYRNGCLAASEFFHMFTQSIKFHTFRYHVLKSTRFKNMIHQIDSKNGWLWMVAPFSKFYGKAWVGFCLNT